LSRLFDLPKYSWKLCGFFGGNKIVGKAVLCFMEQRKGITYHQAPLHLISHVAADVRTILKKDFGFRRVSGG
jgi:hypothetical protein